MSRHKKLYMHGICKQHYNKQTHNIIAVIKIFTLQLFVTNQQSKSKENRNNSIHIIVLNPYPISSSNKSVILQGISRYVLTSTRQRNKSKSIFCKCICLKQTKPIRFNLLCKIRRTGVEHPFVITDSMMCRGGHLLLFRSPDNQYFTILDEKHLKANT